MTDNEAMQFKPVAAKQVVPADPLQLFDDTPRMQGAVPELWRQQADLLRAYAADFTLKSDVAFDLPTGTGKTIVGLYVAEWRRRKFQRPVVYACPTQQLAHQVAKVARREGLPVVTLVGSNQNWPPADQTRYEAAEAVAVTTYNAVFNARPKLGSPGTVLFDDAHAAEQFVADSWTLHVSRQDTAAYQSILDAVAAGLDGMFLQRLASPTADLATRRDVRLVVPIRRAGMTARLDAALESLPVRSDPWWRAQMVRAGLASCLVYVAHRQIAIRPFVPPTRECEPFVEADQRIYLSATLGHAGELNRSFGRQDIRRVPLPLDARAPRSGRRYFVFADLIQGDKLNVAKTVTQRAGKALVLGQSTRAANELAVQLNAGNWKVFTKDDIATGVEPFVDAKNGLLALAGRYDGIDLPGDACRLVVLDGLPDIPHLQEQFLATNLRARAALEERIRTRVVQGAGRATRNPSDHAIVMISGVDLARYLSNPATTGALDPDLQAEVAFGKENSVDIPANSVLDGVRIFLDQGDEWRTGAEPMLNEARRMMTRHPDEGEALLSLSAPHEVDACQQAWRGDYVGAREAAVAAASALSGSERLRSYRSLWLYLAAVWSFAAAAQDVNASGTAAGLLNEAHLAAKGTTWLRETDPGDVPGEQLADDTPAVRRIAAALTAGAKRKATTTSFDEIDEGLAAIEHTKSEPALTELGTKLGAEAFKPSGQGRADSAWCWGERIWIAVEAKTEHDPTGELPLKDVRQANTQLDTLAGDRGVTVPEMSIDVIVSPRTKLAPTAVVSANPNIYLAHPDAMRALARDAREAWTALLLRHKGHTGGDLDALVRRVMSEHRCLPTQVRQRLTTDPVRA